jgi:hypothetical protein
MNFKRWLLLMFIGTGIISFAGGISIGRAIFVPSVPAKAILFSNLRKPANTLTEALGVIMNKSPDDVSQIDPATMYLASLADKEGGYFKALTPLELQAFFLKQRGDYLSAHQSLFDAELAFTAAHRLAPSTPLYDEDMRSVLAEEMKLVGMTWQELMKSCPDYFNLSPPKPDNSITP